MFLQSNLWRFLPAISPVLLDLTLILCSCCWIFDFSTDSWVWSHCPEGNLYLQEVTEALWGWGEHVWALPGGTWGSWHLSTGDKIPFPRQAAVLEGCAERGWLCPTGATTTMVRGKHAWNPLCCSFLYFLFIPVQSLNNIWHLSMHEQQIPVSSELPEDKSAYTQLAPNCGCSSFHMALAAGAVTVLFPNASFD